MESEMDTELRFHIEANAEDLMRSGVSKEDALRRARLEFGGLERAKEECREARGVSFFESLLQDLRYAIRTLRKNPGFTALAILTLALGIGANAAIFGLVDSALLRSMPFHEPERLTNVWTTDAGGDLHTPVPAEYLALRKDSQSFEQIAATGWVNYFYGDDDSHLQTLPGLVVTPNWLPTLGVEPLLGRNFLDEEKIAGREAVVMLSYGCWRSRFHADSHIVGKQIQLNRRAFTVVGVLPQSLTPYYEDVEIFAPLMLESYVNSGELRVAGAVRVRIIARLKPGVTLAQARSETEVIAQRLRNPSVANDRSGHLVVEDFAEQLKHPGPTMQNARRGLWMMAAASGVVLLIACANVASLLLARGVKRQREVAVRAALGCSRGRMIRQLLTETALLFFFGAGLGLVVAQWSQEIITKAATGMIPNGTYLEINGRVFAASLAIALLSALFFGMMPAWHATRVDLNEGLKDAARSAAGVHSRRPRNLLVACQIALGMVLLVGFGLLFRSLLRVESAPLGYDSTNVLTATARLSGSSYADSSVRTRLMHQAVERARMMPGVESAGIADSLRMNGADSAQIMIEASTPKTKPTEEEIWFVSVSPDYFSTLKTPMLAGRPFHDWDAHESSLVAIVNETFAKQYFPTTNPIGYHVAFADSPVVWREIVGVVSDFRQRNPEEDLRPLAYFPVAQTAPGRWSLAIRVRSSNDMASVAQGLAKWFRPVDPQLYWEMGSMPQQIHDSESLTLRRPIITLLASFGTLSLVLALVGVFGVTSYSVTERTGEIGIRAALGAAHNEILGLVLRETLAVTLMGLAVGTLCAFALAQFFPAGSIGWSGSGIFLYGVSRADVLTYSCAAALLASVALAASWLPARRASRVDPMIALRHE
jgi:putative ABC transport system permease protein